MDLSNGIWDKCNITKYLTMEGLGVFEGYWHRLFHMESQGC